MCLDERLTCLEIKPEVASLDPSPIIMPKGTLNVGQPPTDATPPQDKNSGEYERFILLKMVRLFGIVPRGSWVITEEIVRMCSHCDVKPELAIWDPMDLVSD